VRVLISGVVQGVGFRPFVYRLAREHALAGWVLNDGAGVEIQIEGAPERLATFVDALRAQAPPAARIAALAVVPSPDEGADGFTIRESAPAAAATVRISPDLPVCAECLAEMRDPAERRFGYPYVTCTNCGPRYSIVHALPYDRERTTMREWPLCSACRREYDDPADRRFHAQPIACPACGPSYRLVGEGTELRGAAAIAEAAARLRAGAILAVKGIGGYHLACDARDAAAVRALRERKFRRERPFALLVRDPDAARALAEVDARGEALLRSQERPIVLLRARAVLPGVAPDNRDLGIMLPYAPLHHALFDAGAPAALVMTSANRSSEPIAYVDEDALRELRGIADAFVVGERPIARRLDDSVVRIGPAGPTVLRRARGFAPGAAAAIPAQGPILAVGADLKNAPALVVGGTAFVAQHVGDLAHWSARTAFETAVRDLCAMYGVDLNAVTVAHDLHPEYASTGFAARLGGRKHAVQHHRAHVASVLAEHGAWDVPVLGFAFDGTGYGDDGTIWGGEVFHGSLRGGLTRVAHLRPAVLPGGDAAARHPVAAAAGFLAGLGWDRSAFRRAPFAFGARFDAACALVDASVRAPTTTSVGRLFDCAAALLGFTREQSFEGQAAMWLEHLAAASAPVAPYRLPFADGELDYRPLLEALVTDRRRGRAPDAIARAFHGALAAAIRATADAAGEARVVVSGGVFQNALLVEQLADALGDRLWLNRRVPPNDGGISLGQTALACAADEVQGGESA
jgi:hydrogenase maturation protein HypF